MTGFSESASVCGPEPSSTITNKWSVQNFYNQMAETYHITADSLPHLLTRDSMFRAVAEIRRVLRPGGLAVITTRDYDNLRPQRTTGTYPFVLPVNQGRVIAFQVWSWHSDGEHYDLEHFRLMPNGHEECRYTVSPRNSGR